MAPQPIALYSFGPGFGLPEISPYVTKTEVQLQMAGLAYRKASAMPMQAPKGKLPYIDDDGQVVPDSTFIRAHIEHQYGVDLDAGLDAGRRAEAWAIERLLEDHLYWAMVWFRWMVPENFAKGPAHFADRAPEAERAQRRIEMQERVAAALHAQGLGRHRPEEVLELGQRSLAALSSLLSDRPYFMGDRPGAVDATAFAMLAGILTPFFESPLRRAAEGHANLVDYVARMMRRHYPSHSWTPARQAAA